MEYFRLKLDKRYLHTPTITNLSDIIQRRADSSDKKAIKIAKVNIGFAKREPQIDYVDVLDSQLFMVSDRVKQVFQIYEPGMMFKAVCILDHATEGYGNYHIPIFREIDCLDEGSIVTPDKSCVKKLVLKKDVLENAPIFQVKGLLTDVVIIRLDVAESLLRRTVTQLTLERILDT